VWQPFIKINEDVADFVGEKGKAKFINQFEKLI